MTERTPRYEGSGISEKGDIFPEEFSRKYDPGGRLLGHRKALSQVKIL